MTNTNNQPEDPRPQILYRELEEKLRRYLSSEEDLMIVRDAFDLAKDAHAPQKRESGEPYITHPLNVAIILAQLKSDRDTIVAGILHDVVEDTPVTREEITDRFGEEVAFLVDGVTKIEKLHEDLSKKQIKQESFLKLILATAEDIRVIVIKLADRLHNMRTLQFQKSESQENISKETMEIYSPIAQRLGISILGRELEDLAFSYLKPDAHQNILSQVEKNDGYQKILPEMELITRMLNSENIEHELAYYQKNLFHIYRKMLNQHKTMDEIFDIGVIKVIVENERDCYLALWKLHQCYKILPGRIKDFISLPREDMYQALHTTLISENGSQFKVRIKTKEMERFSTYGILSDPKYIQAVEEVGEKEKKFGKKLLWLQSILQWREDSKDTAELIDLVKDDFDLFLEKICCFTPKAEAKYLPKNSSVIDFAYSIHSAIGNKTIGAIVSGRRKGPEAILSDGDVVQVLTKEDSPGPQAEWFDYVKTGNARSNIRKWLKQQAEATDREDPAKVQDDESTYIQIAKCCLPVRGDSVIGIMSDHHYMTVHREHCDVAQKMLRQRNFKKQEVGWSRIKNEEFITTLVIIGEENSDSSWVSRIWDFLNQERYGINRMEFLEKKQKLILSIRIKNRKELRNLIKELKKIPQVVSVSRSE